MCFVINRWQDFEPTDEYMKVIEKLNTVSLLRSFVEKIKWQGETGDYWMTPIEFLENKDENIDCEDFVRFILDVLVRVIGIKGARWIIHSGYNYERWGKVKHCHAICVFPWQGKLAVFSNNRLYVGLNSYEEAGYITFPGGLKYQQRRNSLGKVLETRRQWFGTF